MRSRRLACAVALALVAALGVPSAATARQQSPGGAGKVEVYVGKVTPQQFEELRRTGVDAAGGTGAAARRGIEVEVVLTERQAARLAGKGVELEVKKVKGKAASQALREQAAARLDGVPALQRARRHPRRAGRDRGPLTRGSPSWSRSARTGRASRSRPSR